MMTKLTLVRKKKFKDAYDIMKFGVESGNWKNSSATLFASPAPTTDGVLYERVFYEAVASIKSQWESAKYIHTDNKKKYCTSDHCYKPQGGGKYLLDNPKEWIGDFDKFLIRAEWFSTTIPVTKVENNKLRHETNNISLEETYAAAGIELFENDGEGYDATPYDPFKNVPSFAKEYFEYQKEWIK